MQAGRRKISLIARFEPKNGPVIVGEQTKHYLSGAAEGLEPAGAGPQLATTPQDSADPSVTAATFEATAKPLSTAGRPHAEASVLADPNRLNTMTIPLPRPLGPAAGESLIERRQAAAGRVMQTPHMAVAAFPGRTSNDAIAERLAAITAYGATAAPGRATEGEADRNAQASDEPTGYLQSAELPARSRSAGYQSAQPPVPATRVGR